ncbi:MAG: DUF1492 domain-containing protein [Ruminococcus sp.]|nr:DUF1492 domain-containing protein [Ruminococcus sp.]
MTTKEYLNQAYQIDQRINSKLMQVESLRSLATRVTSVFSDMPHSSTPDNRRLEKTMDKIIDLKNEILDDADELVDLKRDITQTINQIPDLRHRTILEMHYLSFRTWEQIAVALDHDIRHVYRLHGEALKEIKFSERCH